MSEAKGHECPYGGAAVAFPWQGEALTIPCGQKGRLCDMCKRDADRENTTRIENALAGVGLLLVELRNGLRDAKEADDD